MRTHEQLNLDDYRDSIGRIKVGEMNRAQREQIRTPAMTIGKAIGYTIGYGLTGAGLIGLVFWAAHLI